MTILVILVFKKNTKVILNAYLGTNLGTLCTVEFAKDFFKD